MAFITDVVAATADNFAEVGKAVIGITALPAGWDPSTLSIVVRVGKVCLIVAIQVGSKSYPPKRRTDCFLGIQASGTLA